MKKEGLIVEPKYEDVEYYLQEGKMTKITEEIQQIADIIKKDKNISDGMIIRNIITFMNRNVTRLKNSHGDIRKFNRTAQEILESKERTGCCDSATLFRALAIVCGIPTMQIIGIDKENYKGSGHFYSGVYLKDKEENKKWHIIDSDQDVKDINDVKLNIKKDINDRNLGRDYAIAYTLDYREVNVNGISIDSINNMSKVSSLAYDMCDKKDMKMDRSR